MKIGIATENWKVPMFEKALKAAGFAFKTTLGTNNKVSAIVVEGNEEDQAQIAALCASVQSAAFHKKTKEN